MVRQTQSKFTVGELDPLLWARSDTEFYYSGAAKLENFLCLPEGGYTRRAGTLYIDRLHRQLTRDTTPTITAPNGGTGANANDDNRATTLTTTTNIGTVDPYIVVHYDLGSQKNIAVIDIVDVLLTTQTNDTEFFIQVSTDDAVWTTVGQAININTTGTTKRVRVRGTYRYMRFVRIGATDLGTDKITLSEFNVWIEEDDVSISKRIDFQFNIGQTYIIFMTDKNISVYRNGEFKTDIRANAYSVNRIQDMFSTQSGDTAVLFQENVKPHTLQRIDDTTWNLEETDFENISYYNFTSTSTFPAVTLTPNEISGKITLTAGGAAFTAASVGQYIDGNGGRARITAYTSATVVTAITEIPFYTTTAMAAGTWEYETGYEPVWSDTRGWPRSATFFQQRLWIGGSLSRPRTLWASVVGDFFNFDIGSARPSDGIEYDLDEDEPIVNLVSNRSLQIFTTGGESAIIQSRLSPITQESLSVMSQTKVGSKAGLKPVIVDGATLFMKSGGHSIGKFLYTDTEQSYDVTNISLLSSHIIKDPVDLAVRKVTNDQEASYLLIANDDGTLTFGCMLDEQNVKGFSPASTDGLFKNVAMDNTIMYAVILRDIDGIENNYIEKFDFNTYTDSAKQYTTGLPTNTFTGLDHLEGKTCRVKVDGNILSDVVVENGTVTIDRDAETIAEIGLNFNTLYRSLPYANPELVGPTLEKTKKLSRISVRIHNTSEIIINGDNQSFYGLNVSNNPLDASNPVYSGVVSSRVVNSPAEGWDFDGYITITQENPLPLTVLSIESEVDLS